MAGIVVRGEDAVLIGWTALLETMQSWSIRSPEDLSEWIHGQGFRHPRWRAHFSGRVQGRILNKAVARDARCAVLESTYVQITIHACTQGLPPDPVHTQCSANSGGGDGEPPTKSFVGNIGWS